MTVKQENTNIKQKSFINKIKTLINYGSRFLLVLIFSMLVYGLVCIISASINAKTTLSSLWFDIIKQFGLLTIGFLCYFIGHFINVNRISKNFCKLLAFITLILLVVAWICCKSQGAVANNYSWIYFGEFPLRFQPAELAKFTMILLITVCLSRGVDKKDIKAFDYLKTPLLYLIFFVVVIVLLQKDNGSALVVGLVTVLTFLMVNDNHYRWWKVLVILLLIGAIGLYYFCFTEAGQAFLIKMGFTTIANRFNAVINPDYHSDASREIFYSLLGISKGNWWGVGLGKSVQKYGYLAASNTDYIFAIIVEEQGVLGIIFVFGFYFTLMFYLLRYARRMRKERERVFIVGTVILLFIHFFLNIGGVSGLIPLTGIPLLLLSRGGSSLAIIMLCLGICQRCIINYNKYEEKSPVEKIKAIKA